MKLVRLHTLAIATCASLACLAVACSPPTPPAPPPLDPTGTFDFAIELEGEVIEGVITIEGNAADGYEGEVVAMGNTADIHDVAIEGSNVAFVVRAEGLSVVFDLAFEGTGFSGVFDSEMGSGTVIGTKR